MTNSQMHGFVFAATGEGYTALAVRAAATVRDHHPDIPIDLFTDTPTDAPVFDQIHTLERSWHRPKMGALRRSRFARTIYLDADLFVLADISDIFDTLDQFDIAAAHDQERNDVCAVRQWTKPLPSAFPQYNSGVIGIKRSPQTDALLRQWEDAVFSANADRDQPALREFLYDSDLRIATLPPEYNLMDISQLATWTSQAAAPRVIHHYLLHMHIGGNWPQIESVEQLLGGRLFRHIGKLNAADKLLTPDATSAKVPAPIARCTGIQPPNPYRRTKGQALYQKFLVWLRSYHNQR